MDKEFLNTTTYKTIVFFDSDCLFCNFWIQFILKHDNKKQIYFAPLQSKYADQTLFPIIGNTYKNLNTLYLYHNQKIYKKSKAVFQICTLLGDYFSVILIFRAIPTVINDFFYDLIAKNRHKIIKNSCPILKDKQILS